MINKKLLSESAWEIKTSSNEVKLERKWEADCCQFSIINNSDETVRVQEAVLFAIDMHYPADTAFYGEGYSKLSQYQGSLETFENITYLSDYEHYKLPQQAGCFTVYNMLHLFPTQEDSVLMGFSSCHRLSGEFRFNTNKLEVVMDCENLEIAPGEKLDLEEFFIASGEREALLEEFSQLLQKQHPRLPYPKNPTGWCSWYCYGPDVTEEDIFANLAAIKKDLPELEFIQIDDGYQNKMGDWLTPHPNFPNGVKELCLQIKDAGLEPAIWVAPFIAEKDSELFKNHPDWFIKDDEGNPLSSGDVSFGGWRYGPWYMLDGTHPEARNYLKHVFKTIREEWQCRYFKLDANMWGAMPFGHRYDPKATKVEAYRQGMQAALEGAGENSFLLGCNAPMWPSIGTVHGMRTTGDINRKWDIFKILAQECFNRNWQHGALWYNDPDCLVLKNLHKEQIGPDGKTMTSTTQITENEFSFHAAHLFASGGMILSSDIIMDLEDKQRSMIKKMLKVNGQAATFDDRTFKVGRIKKDKELYLCLFNWNNTKSVYSINLDGEYDICDYWTDEKIAKSANTTPPITMPPHSGRVLLCKTAKQR